MPVLTSPPLIGGAGKPVTGRVAISPTASYVWGGQHVTTAPQAGVVRGGQFFDLDGRDPLTIMPTPDGVGMRIILHLEEQGASRGEHRESRIVRVPDVETVAWADLVDVVPPVTGGDYIVPAWAESVFTARDEAYAARDAALAAQAAAEDAAAGGGASALADLTDVNATNPIDGHVLTYDSGTAKARWEAPTGGSKIVVSDTAPADTTAIWLDTSGA